MLTKPGKFRKTIRTEIANDACDLASSENITLVEHHQRNGKPKAKMSIDKVNLIFKLVFLIREKVVYIKPWI